MLLFVTIICNTLNSEDKYRNQKHGPTTILFIICIALTLFVFISYRCPLMFFLLNVMIYYVLFSVSFSIVILLILVYQKLVVALMQLLFIITDFFFFKKKCSCSLYCEYIWSLPWYLMSYYILLFFLIFSVCEF